MRRIDKEAIEEIGIPGRDLMEKAGEGVAAKVRDLLPEEGMHPFVVLIAGKGNNGGDALVAARLLHQEGIKTRTFLLAKEEELKGDAALNLSRLKEAGAPLIELGGDEDLKTLFEYLSQSAVVVDGIFGTGFKGEVRGPAAEVIKAVNETPARLVAVDIPSGLEGESGKVEGEAVRVDWTVTMGLPKTGLVRGKGLDYSGRICVMDIGFPPDLIDEVSSEIEMIDPQELRGLLPPRRPVSHKGDYGHVLVLAGSPGFTGAAALTSVSALRAGAGLVTLGVPESLNPILETKCTELMTLPLPETAQGTFSPEAKGKIMEFCARATVVALGPGLSRNEETGGLVKKLVKECPLPMVIDADGLNLLAGDVSVLTAARSPLILTPHPGEMVRLTGMAKEELLKDREKAARDFAEKYNVTLVLKGAGTLIAPPSGPLWINLTGNPGMASGGTGDVLTGLIAGFLGQGLSPLDAARLGVYLHGAAGDRAAKKVGRISLIATDLLAEVPPALKNLFPWN